MGGDGLKGKFQVSAKKNIFLSKIFLYIFGSQPKKGVQPITCHHPSPPLIKATESHYIPFFKIELLLIMQPFN
jgi:hypothetical protein